MKVKIVGRCKSCDVPYCVYANRGDVVRWQGGELVQDCFPYLDAGRRELLVSGICEPCFDGIFPEGEVI